MYRKQEDRYVADEADKIKRDNYDRLKIGDPGEAKPFHCSDTPRFEVKWSKQERHAEIGKKAIGIAENH